MKILKKGSRVALRVQNNFKDYGTPFLPEFIDQDYPGVNYVYFYNPINLNGQKFHEGEDWFVEIIKIDILDKEVRGGYKVVSVLVKVGGRKIEERREVFSYSGSDTYYRTTYSGNYQIKKEEIPVETTYQIFSLNGWIVTVGRSVNSEAKINLIQIRSVRKQEDWVEEKTRDMGKIQINKVAMLKRIPKMSPDHPRYVDALSRCPVLTEREMEYSF